MIFEHFALNVSRPVEMAEWYVNNFEMKIVRAMEKSPFTRFLSDKTGRVVLEIYSNNNAPVPDRNKVHSLEFHFAFMVDDVPGTRDALIRAGAIVEEELHMEDGSHLIMFRDPFGVPVQICKRGTPMMKF